MDILRIAAFSDGEKGGNPAGVCITDSLPSAVEMQNVAAQIGYSETVFAEPSSDSWRVRYFSPESEVPFCGHATIALGAALAERQGPGIFSLVLNEATISVEGIIENGVYSAALQSPETSSLRATDALTSVALKLFGYQMNDVSEDISVALANGGANHLIIGLNNRKALSAMNYDLDAGRKFMREEKLVTVMFAFAESIQKFHTRNAFASGGVYEDPATGAATAAFAGYLRDINWSHNGTIDIIQGEDMGSRSLIRADFSDVPSSSIRVSGSVRRI